MALKRMAEDKAIEKAAIDAKIGKRVTKSHKVTPGTPISAD